MHECDGANSPAVLPLSPSQTKLEDGDDMDAGSDGSMPPIVSASKEDVSSEGADAEEQQVPEDHAGSQEDYPAFTCHCLEELEARLREKDQEIRALKTVAREQEALVQEQSRQLNEAEKQIGGLRERSSLAEKSLGKRDSELKKRGAEIANLKDSLAMKEAELEENNGLLSKLQEESPSQSLAKLNENLVEIVAKHALEDVELKVRVPVDASFRDVKNAIAKKVGCDDVLTKGRLLRKLTGTYSAYQDKCKVGNVRQVLVLGVGAELLKSSQCVDEARQTEQKSNTCEGLEARILELEALLSKKDGVLRGVLGELKRLREEQSHDAKHSEDQKSEASTTEAVSTQQTCQRPPLPVVEVAKLVKQKSRSGHSADEAADVANMPRKHRPPLPVVEVAKSAMLHKKRSLGTDHGPPAEETHGNQQSLLTQAEPDTAAAITDKHSHQRPPLPVVDVARMVQEQKLRTNLPPKSTMWKALVASRAKLKLQDEIDSSNGDGEAQEWSLSQFLQASTNRRGLQNVDQSEGVSAHREVLDTVLQSGSDHGTDIEMLSDDCNTADSVGVLFDEEDVQSNEDSGTAKSQFSISSFVRDCFGADGPEHRMNMKLWAAEERPLLSKFLREHSNSGVSNAETLTVSSDEPVLAQGSELDSDIDLTAIAYNKDDLDDKTPSGDFSILLESSAPTAQLDGTNHCTLEHVSDTGGRQASPDATPHSEEVEEDTAPKSHRSGFAAKLAVRAARKAAQTQARELAVATAILGSQCSSSSSASAAPRQMKSIPIASGIRPKWRLDNFEDVDL
jgi:hypothetical protein